MSKMRRLGIFERSKSYGESYLPNAKSPPGRRVVFLRMLSSLMGGAKPRYADRPASDAAQALGR
jgi:hypothetical protein